MTSQALLIAAVWLALVLLTVWTTAALYLAFPISRLRPYASAGYALVMLAIFISVNQRPLAIGLVLAGLALVFLWWWTVRPSNQRSWRRDVARTAFAEIEGDAVTLHNVRNFEYRTKADYTERWETRTVRISDIVGTDCSVIYWGSPWIAHVIVSFRFAEGLPIAFSIETRNEVGEEYSTVAGIFRRYELIYVVADERDVIRLRTNYRQGEDVYLFHLQIKPEQAREIFLDYLRGLNALHARPRFYNALTSNCTTNVLGHIYSIARKQKPRWHWRLLLNGKLDGLVYERGAFDRSLPFAELKKRSLINPVARTLDGAPGFSARIREGLPGF